MKFILVFIFVFSLAASAMAQEQEQPADKPGVQQADQSAEQQSSEQEAQQAEDAALQAVDDTPEDQKDLAQQVEDARLALSMAIKDANSQADESTAGDAQDQHSRDVFVANRLVQAAKIRELSVHFHELSQKLMAQQAEQQKQQQ